jgi:folate-binding protein YgfZ
MSPADTYARFREQGGVADLSARAKFHLTGEDRVRYLNGQVSNDVRKLTGDSSLYACVMTAKGRMCADVFISAGADFLRVDAEPSLRESLSARLERYIISDDVTLLDVTDEKCLLHVLGANAKFNFSAVESIRAMRFGSMGVDLSAPQGERDALRAELVRKFVVLDEEMLEVLRIEAGVPRWGFELTEETIPVEAGLEKSAIDYEKGCYIGQEIISRLRSIGHVNKELRGFVVADNAPLERGMQLFDPGMSGQQAGWLTSVAYSFGLQQHVALGYLKRGVSSQTLHARAAGDERNENIRAVQVRELPLIPSP